MPLNEAEATQQALQALHAINAQRGPKVPMPQGQRILAAPFMEQHYQGPDATTLLGNPNLILKDPNPGSRYVWRTYKKDPYTATKIRTGVLRPVQLEEIDPDSEYADILEVKTPEGSYVVWENQALFEMVPKFVAKYYTAYENWSIARLAQQMNAFPAQVEAATGGNYTGSIRIGEKGKS
jgi:hypothetical protein